MLGRETKLGTELAEKSKANEIDSEVGTFFSLIIIIPLNRDSNTSQECLELSALIRRYSICRNYKKTKY